MASITDQIKDATAYGPAATAAATTASPTAANATNGGQAQHTGASLRGITGAGLLPAQLARYRDLSQLRYDYPLVLGEGPRGLRPLVEVFNELAQRTAPRGASGERQRRLLLGLEGEIRTMVSRGERATLGRLWQLAQRRLPQQGEEAATEGLTRAREALDDSLAESAVLDCTPQTASRVVTHLWLETERERLAPFAQRIGRLLQRLIDILEADWARSSDARTPEAVASSLGSSDTVDPAALASLLAPLPTTPLPAERAARIRRTLETLRYQRFVALPQPNGVRPAVHPFAFDSCGAALTAYKRRLPEMVALIRAIRVAELELDNGYREEEHDAHFANFDSEALTAEDLQCFPAYLVRLKAAEAAEADKALMMDALASRLPLKILVEHDDLLASGPHAPGPCGPDAWGARLGLQALGLATSFVLQAPASHIPLVADQLAHGLARRGPALLSVYVGHEAADGALPSYLQTAAALQCRAFSAFVYDPDAGDGLAARFDISLNPQPERCWPRATVAGRDAELQRFELELPFSWSDFAASERCNSAHFLQVSALKDAGATNGEHASIWMVDDTNTIHEVLVGSEVQQGQRRCAERWRAIQELAGVHSSLVDRALQAAREAWEAERGESPTNDSQPPSGDAGSASAEAAPEGEDPTLVARAEGEAYIDSWRCTSCNECINANPKMFAYDDKKQAQIIDRGAGTFLQLVEAAERCQLAIIHPGAPSEGEEASEALLTRAKLFNV